MAGIIRLGNGIKQAGISLMILGIVIFGCHHCSRSTTPALYEIAYPVCGEDYNVNLDNTSKTITIYKDCWSGKFNIAGGKSISAQTYPENQPFMVMCDNKQIAYSNSSEGWRGCFAPVRYRSVDKESMKITLSDNTLK